MFQFSFLWCEVKGLQEEETAQFVCPSPSYSVQHKAVAWAWPWPSSSEAAVMGQEQGRTPLTLAGTGQSTQPSTGMCRGMR